MVRVRDVIGALGTTRLAYLIGPAVDVEHSDFFDVQFMLTPVVLSRNSADGQFVLVNFGKGNPTVAMPGLVLAEDFKNGLALFRRQG